MNTYETPFAELVTFNYKQQAAVSNGTANCIDIWTQIGATRCETTPVYWGRNNL